MYDSDSDCDVFPISESDDGQDSTNQLLKSTWASVGLDHKEEDLIGKWYGVVYRGKKKVTLYIAKVLNRFLICLLYTSPSPRDRTRSRMPSSA